MMQQLAKWKRALSMLLVLTVLVSILPGNTAVAAAEDHTGAGDVAADATDYGANDADHGSDADHSDYGSYDVADGNYEDSEDDYGYPSDTDEEPPYNPDYKPEYVPGEDMEYEPEYNEYDEEECEYELNPALPGLTSELMPSPRMPHIYFINFPGELDIAMFDVEYLGPQGIEVDVRNIIVLGNPFTVVEILTLHILDANLIITAPGFVPYVVTPDRFQMTGGGTVDANPVPMYTLDIIVELPVGSPMPGSGFITVPDAYSVTWVSGNIATGTWRATFHGTMPSGYVEIPGLNYAMRISGHPIIYPNAGFNAAPLPPSSAFELPSRTGSMTIVLEFNPVYMINAREVNGRGLLNLQARPHTITYAGTDTPVLNVRNIVASNIVFLIRPSLIQQEVTISAQGFIPLTVPSWHLAAETWVYPYPYNQIDSTSAQLYFTPLYTLRVEVTGVPANLLSQVSVTHPNATFTREGTSNVWVGQTLPLDRSPMRPGDVRDGMLTGNITVSAPTGYQIVPSTSLATPARTVYTLTLNGRETTMTVPMEALTPTVTLSNASVTVNDANLTPSTTVQGTATGNITLNPATTVRPGVTIAVNQATDVITVTGQRPAFGQPDIVSGPYTVQVTREGQNATLTVYVNLTALPQDTFTVTFDANSGTRVSGGQLVQSGIASGGNATLPVVERANHRFVQWNPVDDHLNVTTDRTLTAQWLLLNLTLNPNPVTINSDAGVAVAVGGNATGAITLGTPSATPPAGITVTESGGVITVSGGQRPAFGDPAIVTSFTVPVTREGITETLVVSVNLQPLDPTTGSIIYNDNGGSNGPGTVSGLLPGTQALNHTPLPERAGHYFLGWSASQYLVPIPITGSEPTSLIGSVNVVAGQSATVFAVWAVDTGDTGIPDFRRRGTIVYNLSGGQGGPTPSTQTVLEGLRTLEGLRGSSNAPTHGNMMLNGVSVPVRFVGWSLSPQTAILRVGDTIPTLVEQVTVTVSGTVNVHAVWSFDGSTSGYPDVEDSGTITYVPNAQGRTVGNMPSPNPSTVLAGSRALTGTPTHGSIGTVPVLFVGWSLNPIGIILEAGDDSYLSQIVTNVNVPLNDDIRVYAVWGFNRSNTNYPDVLDSGTITYNANAATEVTVGNMPYPNPATVAAGANVGLSTTRPQHPQVMHNGELTNVAFLGWSLTQTAGILTRYAEVPVLVNNVNVPLNGDTEVFAVWRFANILVDANYVGDGDEVEVGVNLPPGDYTVSVENDRIIVTIPDEDAGNVAVSPPSPEWGYTTEQRGDDVIVTFTPPPGSGYIIELPPGGGNPVIYINVYFSAGAHGTIVGDDELRVRRATVLAAADVPSVNANAGRTHVGWVPEPVDHEVLRTVTFVARYDTSILVDANYGGNGDEVEVEVTLPPGAYYVDVDEDENVIIVTIPGEDRDDVIASPPSPEWGVNIYQDGNDVVVTFTPPPGSGYIIELPPGGGNPVIYLNVTFSAGAHGTLMARFADFRVRRGTVLEEAQVPLVVANLGRTHVGWSPVEPIGHEVLVQRDFVAQYDTSILVDAEYGGNGDEVDVTVSLPPGNYEVDVDDENNTIVVIIPDEEKEYVIVSPPSPGWNYTIEQDDDGNVIVTITPPPSSGYELERLPDGTIVIYITVNFDAGEHGTLEGNEYVRVRRGTVLVEEDVPGVIANVGYTQDGWAPSEPVEHEVIAQITFTAEWEFTGINFTVEVRDVNGNLITNANLAGVEGIAELEPGRFEVTGARPADILTASAAGFQPNSHTVSADDYGTIVVIPLNRVITGGGGGDGGPGRPRDPGPYWPWFPGTPPIAQTPPVQPPVLEAPRQVFNPDLWPQQDFAAPPAAEVYGVLGEQLPSIVAVEGYVADDAASAVGGIGARINPQTGDNVSVLCLLASVVGLLVSAAAILFARRRFAGEKK